MSEIFAISLYFLFLIGFAKFRQKKGLTHSDFVIGSRSLNKWATALSAHASDMSNWLFMAYPGMIFIKGGQHIWAAVGLTLIMWVNWIYVAPKIRIASENSNSVTLCEFFESKLQDSWPSGRILTSIALFVFYTVYVAAILCGVGMLLQILFPISYSLGILIGVSIVLPLLLMGGYSTLAEIDLFQGLFLLGVIVFVPIYIIANQGGVGQVITSVYDHGKSLSLFGNHSILSNFSLMFGWGLGYFGQPHILTKFMGIKYPSELKFSRRIGMSWQIISLFAATTVGFVGIAAFQHINNPELIFINLVRNYFPSFISGIFLCAIIAAIINAMSSMLLVLSTTISEDFYKRFSKGAVSEKKQLFITRFACLISALIALSIAMIDRSTINSLVEYAWSGLGATFGPLVIAFLFFKNVTKRSAWLGMLVGSSSAFLWPLLRLGIPSLIFAFPLSLGVIYLSSRLVEKKAVTF